jgi:hypothetical protein
VNPRGISHSNSGINNKSYRGIFILDTPSLEEAQQMVGTNPSIASKFLDTELYSWYGSAALPEYLNI